MQKTQAASFDRKVDMVLSELLPYQKKQLMKLSIKENIEIICNFILSGKTEGNMSDYTRKTYISTLIYLSRFVNKSFLEMTRDEIIDYLNSLRKPEESDPLHKWKGTYNLYRTIFIKFFKWLYFRNMESNDRPKPDCVQNIPLMKRKEKSIYKPTDLWSAEDDLLFLKYCPSKKDRCYHAISRDSSCRPHEILKLRIKDVVFKMAGDSQYAEILVNGKTGSRHIPLIDSIPYLKDWIDDHPQRGNPNGILLCTLSRNFYAKKSSTMGLYNVYRRYKEYFSRLLNDPSIAPEDKNKIQELVKKPWNPYIRRHSALTEKSKILKEHVLRQHAGWSGGSQMHLKYLHYFGNESSESILEAYGIVTKDQQLQDQLKPKPCPNCTEPNKPDSKFCVKCRMVLSYDAYQETVDEREQKTDELKTIKEQLNSMQSQMHSLLGMVACVGQEERNDIAKQLIASGIYHS